MSPKASISPKTKPRKDFMKRADKLFSAHIRARDGRCVACGSTDFLQCAHIISRSYKTIRVDPDNAVALCRGCHTRYTHDPLGWQDFIEAMFPGRWARLRKRALTYERVGWRQEHDSLKRLVG